MVTSSSKPIPHLSASSCSCSLRTARSRASFATFSWWTAGSIPDGDFLLMVFVDDDFCFCFCVFFFSLFSLFWSGRVRIRGRSAGGARVERGRSAEKPCFFNLISCFFVFITRGHMKMYLMAARPWICIFRRAKKAANVRWLHVT